ncbi:MAG: AccI family restriction endonuclease [Bacteroidetes bacterium]|nr:AccI family restriction endonuclease [Bacteroidota bacterium]
MGYKEKISVLAKKVPSTIVDFDEDRLRGRAPTQAFSEFLTNREQGDWAEDLIIRAINSLSKNYVAVKYGKSDNLVAGEDGFDDFYESYQDELDDIGKRPDLLLFQKDKYDDKWQKNISRFSKDELDKIVPLAIAGLEIRSSSFLIDKYDEEMNRRTTEHIAKVLDIKNKILTEYKGLLEDATKKKYIALLEKMDDENLSIIDFRVPSWRSSEELIALSELFKEIKSSIKVIQKRDFLSITPKVEDIKIVYKWIQTYNVPHYYFQVFFDKVYGIAFEHILELITNADNEGVHFFVESGDAKNQNKATIKINAKTGQEIAHKVDMPEHFSQMKELERGRLLFHVSFRGGEAYLNVTNLLELLNIDSKEF